MEKDRGERTLEFLVDEHGREDGRIRDEHGFGIDHRFEEAILGLDQTVAPFGGEAGGFEGVPEISVAEEDAHFFGGEKRTKCEAVVGGGFSVGLGGDEGDAMSAREQSGAQAYEGQDVSVGPEGGEDRVHPKFDRAMEEAFRLTAAQQEDGKAADGEGLGFGKNFGGGAGVAVVTSEMFSRRHACLANNDRVAVEGFDFGSDFRGGGKIRGVGWNVSSHIAKKTAMDHFI